MEAAVVAGVEIALLGPLRVRRGTRAVALPASRKVRAMLAYLAMSPLPVGRSPLCELLWEVPDDPRGELRWCLSKLRAVVDEPKRKRVETRDDAVSLDLSDCVADALEVARAVDGGLEALSRARKRELAAWFRGDFLEGLEIPGSPAFTAWLTAQRRRFRAAHAALLEQLARDAPDAEALEHLEAWLRIAPFDRRVHELLLAVLVRTGRLREGEEHVAAAIRQFEAEGLDAGQVRAAWAAARGRDAALVTVEAAPLLDQGAGRRASIAVMPFADAADTPRGGLARALAYDVITRLAKLRSLFVIAQGTVFALHERGVGPEEAGRMLGVDYVVSGAVAQAGGRVRVHVELAETRSVRAVWAETFTPRAGDAFQVLDEIGDRIVASIAAEVEAIERNRAVLRPPSSLDAWEAHHRGLWHMYRFNRADNERARHFFATAVALDPTFARAHAGLSFTHFQNAFQGWGPRQRAADRALEAAGQSLMADDRDPAAHWAMGRALWLRGEHDPSVAELERAVDLSPNFAVAHYTLGFVRAQAGDARQAIASVDQSRELSPFDPMLFGIYGARAIALVRLGRAEEAAPWAVKAASRPNAHAHILAIAAYTLALAGDLAEARRHAAAVRKRIPGYGIADFLAAFRLDAEGEALFRRGAKRLRLD